MSKDTKSKFGICGGETKEQRVNTPLSILDPLIADWGGIVLDPAGDPAHLFAKVTLVPADEPGGRPTSYRKGDHTVLPSNGLAYEWYDRTFINPPFCDLKLWMNRWIKLIESGADTRVCMLAPVRTHRVWWRKLARMVDQVVYLNPVKFVGHDCTFPPPLALLSTGVDESTFLGIGEEI